MSDTPEPGQSEELNDAPDTQVDVPAGDFAPDLPNEFTPDAPADELPLGDFAESETQAEPGGGTQPVRTINGDEMGDAASIPDFPGVGGDAAASGQDADWDSQLSAHRVVVELKRVEAEVRELLFERDPKRKRKLSGSRRWRELEEDLLAWKFSGRIEEDTLRRLHRLIYRRDHLFRRLRFLAGSRLS